jgi:hypothetical protein
MRTSPLTGERSEWRWRRHYGCNSVVASCHLLTFRSAAAGFYDLARDGGTGNLGGFKSGCSNNLIVADGVLAAPDYTRTCKCSYQNQSSIGLIHDPEVELWTFNSYDWSGSPVKRMGLNFGAPGDRVAADGTLWLDLPSAGSRSPDPPVSVEPLKALPADVIPPRLGGRRRRDGELVAEPAPEPRPETFRMHSSEVTGGGLKWVAASGLVNVRRMVVNLGKGERRTYTLRLHFCEPRELAPGKRVFDVRVQGRQAMTGLDVAKEAGGPRRALVKEAKRVAVREKLELTFTPARDSAGAVISGLEVILEKR